MSPDLQLWSCALELSVAHGQQAKKVVANHIGNLEQAGDWFAAATWKSIAERLKVVEEIAARGERQPN